MAPAIKRPLFGGTMSTAITRLPASKKASQIRLPSPPRPPVTTTAAFARSMTWCPRLASPSPARTADVGEEQSPSDRLLDDGACPARPAHRGHDRRFAAQEIEVAAFVGLEDVLDEQRAVAARVRWRARAPGFPAGSKLGVRDQHVEP